MNSDKAFAIWAVSLIAAVASVLTATIVAGIATVPSLGVFLEHMVLAFGFRAAYKSFGGVELPSWLPAARDAAADAADAASGHADATS